MTYSELVEHHAVTVRLIESMIMRRTPRFVRPKGLTDDEVTQIAHRLADAQL